MNHPDRQPAKRSLETIRFGEFLCARKLITDEQLLDALGDHWAHGGRIGAAIWRRGYLEADEIERQAAEYHGLAIVEIDGAQPSPGTNRLRGI